MQSQEFYKCIHISSAFFCITAETQSKNER